MQLKTFHLQTVITNFERDTYKKIPTINYSGRSNTRLTALKAKIETKYNLLVRTAQ